MALSLLFFLVGEEPRKWVRIMVRILFAATIFSVLLSYSRGGLLGLAVVITAISLRSRHKVLGVGLLAVTSLLVFSFAPPTWMDRMGNFVHGNLDGSADMRLVSWTVACRLAQGYPMWGSFVDVPTA